MTLRSVGAVVSMGCLFSVLTAVAEEKPADAVKAGDKGTIVGVIVKKEGGKLTIEGENVRLVVMPYWRGGMPKDGGGFDKDMMKRLETFKVGDKVKVTWTMEEHHRIDTIELVEAGRKREEPR